MKTLRQIIILKSVIISITLSIFTSSIWATHVNIGPSTINTDTTWASDTVSVNGDITIASTAKLTIEPGTVVSFTGWYMLTVNGIINAAGTEEDSIVFTRDDTTGYTVYDNTDGAWKGIILQNTTNPTDSFVFRFCRFEFTKNAGGYNLPSFIKYLAGHQLNIERSFFNANRGGILVDHVNNVFIDSCIFINNKFPSSSYNNWCIEFYINSASNINISNSSFIAIADRIVYMENCNDITIHNNIMNVISSDARWYIEIHGCKSQIKITKNTLTKSSGVASGIKVDNSEVFIDSNTISIDSYTAINLFNSARGIISNNTIDTCSIGIDGDNSFFAIRGNTFTHCDYAIKFIGFSKVNIDNNIINKNSKGIDLTQCEAEAKNNFICNNSQCGVVLNKSSITITNSLIANNKSTGSASAIYASYSTCNIINSTIANNLDNNSALAPITYSSSVGNTYNTIFYGNETNASDDYQVCVTENSIQPSFYYCSFSDTTYAIKLVENATHFSGEFKNILVGNPLFIKPTNGAGNSFDALADTINWTMTDTSLFVNAGLTSANNTDSTLNNKPRVLNGIVDIGAFETRIPKEIYSGASITGEVHWRADTIVINSSFDITNTGSLYIGPGVTVLFTGLYSIHCWGLIKAIGTQKYNINFTIDDTTGYSSDSPAGGWYGIMIYQDASETDTTQFEFCHFKYLRAPIMQITNRNKLKIENNIFDYSNHSTNSTYFILENTIASINNNTFSNISEFYSLITIHSGSQIEFEKNVMYNNKAVLIDFSSSEVNMLNNKLFNNGSVVITYYSGSTGKFMNNLIFNNEWCITKFNNSIVANNTITGNSKNDYSKLEIGSSLFENNIISNNSFSSLIINGSDNTPAICRNNYLSSYVQFENTTCTDCILDDNPMFSSPTNVYGYSEDAPTADWHLSGISKAINKGNLIVTDLPSTDLDGNKRVNDGTIDMGAYEHQGGIVSLTKHPVGGLVCEGDSFLFFVSVNDEALFQWQKDGQNIAGATHDTLILSDITTSAQGIYACKISNGYGSIVSNGGYLNIKTRPKLLSSPENRLVAAESQLSVDVPVTGYNPITYTWYTNDTINSLFSGPTLKFISFNTANEGNYKLFASNECGADSTDIFSLTIMPETIIQGADSQICEGETITLRTVAGSTASRQWRKNGKDITGATGEYLTFNSIQTDNAGSYNCMVTSNYGNSLTNAVYLSVSEFPEVVVQPSPQWTSIGESFTTEVSAIGSKPLSYQWYKNDTAITGEDDPRFIIAGFQTDDEGIYHCRVTNMCGSDTSSNAFIYITPSLSIFNNNVHNILCEGDTVTMSAYSGIGASYQWYKDGSAINGATSSNFDFTGISTSEGGNYYCIVSRNGQTKQTETRTLSVQTAPDILVQPSSQWAIEGGAYSVEVAVSGSKPLSYQWYQDGTIINTATSASYVIAGFASGNEGRFFCNVQNACGTITTVDAYLLLTPKITITNGNGKSIVCEPDTITISANSGTGAGYQWFKDGNKIAGATNSNIIYYGITQTEVGNYYCIVTRDQQSKQTEIKTISVLTPPEILMQPENQWTDTSSSYSLSVSANGSKPLNYIWFKNNDPVISDNSGRYVFGGFEPGDEGIYTCVVSNSCGTDTSRKAAMYIMPQIKILSGDASPVACEGDSFKLSMNNSYPASYQWQKDGQNISGATSSTLIVKNVTENSAGNYLCKVNTNYLSVVTASVLLQVRSVPYITDEPSGTLISTNDPLSLDVRAEGQRPISYQWQINGVNINGKNFKGDTTMHLRIDSFDLENEGSYVCRITNICGNVYSLPAIVNLAPEICMVTVTTNTKDPVGHNTIIWDKHSKVNYKQYNIYRQTSTEGSYLYLGSVPGNDVSQFDDTLVDPARMAYYYKITATDQDNNETDINLCKPHKNIHLMVTQQYGKPNIQLQWDEYIGFDYKTYFIYRSSDDITGFGGLPYDSIASTNLAWTDVNVVPATGSSDPVYFYFVSVKKTVGCDSRVNTRKKAGGGLFSQAESNMEDNRLQSANKIVALNSNTFELSCSPNPFNNCTKLSYRLTESNDIHIEVLDMIGQVVYKLNNTRQLPGKYKYTIRGNNLNQGIYIVKLSTGNNSIMTKLVKE